MSNIMTAVANVMMMQKMETSKVGSANSVSDKLTELLTLDLSMTFPNKCSTIFAVFQLRFLYYINPTQRFPSRIFLEQSNI